MKKNLIQQVVGAILCFIGVAFLVASQPTLEWTVFHDANEVVTVRYGLYEICPKDDRLCVDIPWKVNYDNNYTWAPLITRIGLIIADVFVAGGIFATFSAFIMKGLSRRRSLISSCSLHSTGGTFALLSVIAYTVASLLTYLDDLSKINAIKYSYGYSYAFVWVSGVLLIAGGIVQKAAVPQVMPAAMMLQPTTQVGTTQVANVVLSTDQNPMVQYPLPTAPQPQGLTNGGYCQTSLGAPAVLPIPSYTESQKG